MNLREILKLLQHAYPRQDITDNNTKAYTLMLRDLPIEVLEIAALQIIRESKWYPTIAEITGRVADLQLKKAGHISAIEAYQMAMQNSVLELKQDYQNVLAAAKMSCGSVSDMRRSENPTADRARFIEAYNEITSQKRNEIINAPAVKMYLESNNGQQLIGEGNHANS